MMVVMMVAAMLVDGSKSLKVKICFSTAIEVPFE